jgi:CHAT domain-containing protein
LLSGLVLAGANQAPQPERDDGILTALEVAGLDLGGVELATLSACETGLGETAGGEGLLGLQRSFQVAGTRTVVAGLWKVPDRATQMLMERFYQNLWQKKMDKLFALREAQLWMLREGQHHPEIQRGLHRLANEAPWKEDYLPPYYWAAFVLSGDWR